MESRTLICKIQKDPNSLDQLRPRQFEKVTAELLASFGWKVSLTPQTKDGGYDALAVSSDGSGLESSWLVECKRFSPPRKVDVEVARQLHGVKNYLGVQNSIIVTSSDFSRDARKVADSEPSLHLIDRGMFLDWVNGYKLKPESEEYIKSNSFYSCFISHSAKDHAFAQKLNDRLRREGVRIWYAPEDMKPGQKVYDQIGRAIKQFDRLLIVISENSMASEWVRTELLAAKERELIENRQVLFPIGLAPISTIKRWRCMDSDSGIDVARELREYHIPDFSNWKEGAIFEYAISKVVDSLRASDADHNEFLRRKSESRDLELKATMCENAGDYSGAAEFFKRR